MALIQHRQIKDRIVSQFVPHIDVSDVNARNLENTSVSRGLCAFALTYLADVDSKTACLSVVDGFKDNGIDAIFFDSNDRTLYLIQGKWNKNHTGGVENGDVLKFLQGAKDLMNSRFEKFNNKVKKRKTEIESALSVASKVVVCVAYSGSGSFGDENRRSLDAFVNDVDETKELVSYSILNQNVFHSHILLGAQGASVSDTLTLFYWGYIEEPVKAYYGQISASDIVNLHKKYGYRLFSKNIRMFLGAEGGVNRSIMESAESAPEHFWYFNNGITALANSLQRKMVGGANRDSG